MRGENIRWVHGYILPGRENIRRGMLKGGTGQRGIKGRKNGTTVKA